MSKNSNDSDRSRIVAADRNGFIRFALAGPAKVRRSISAIWSRIGQRSGSRRQKVHLSLLERSQFFNEGWYLARYPDVAAQGMDAARHYLLHGGPEGRSPGPGFNGQWYLEKYADVRESGLNPLIHYLENGQAEGRRIKPVDGVSRKRVSRDELAQRFSIGGSPPTEKATDAAIGSWRAGIPSFAALEYKLGSPPSNGPLDLLFESGHFIIDGRMIKSGRDDPAAHAFRLCLKWMEALTSPAFSKNTDELASIIHNRMGAGGPSLQDCWFIDDATLRLRFDASSPAVSASTSIRCFQQDSASRLVTCAEASAPGTDTRIVDVRLQSRFRPMLLVLCDADERLMGCSLLAFPTLARGGLHHAEHWSAERNRALPGTQAYTLELLRSCDSGAGRPTVSKIEVDLSEATGIEPLFHEDHLRWLGKDLGIEITAVGSAADTAWLAERIADFSARSTGSQRPHGGTLMLPSTAIPSLRLLFAGSGGVDDGLTRYLVANPHSNEPVAEWELPVRADLPFIQRVPRVRSGEAGSGGFAGPVAIIFVNEPETAATSLFPIAGDSRLPVETDSVSTEKRSISVVVTGTADRFSIAALAQALSNQLGIFDLELILACPVADADLELIESSTAIPIVRPSLETDNGWQRACEAAKSARGSRLWFASTHFLPHDPRTLAALLAISEMKNVGTVGCALIANEAQRKDAGHSAQVGYLGEIGNHGDQRDCSLRLRPVRQSQLPPNLLVAANSPHCLLIDRTIWEECADSLASADDPWLHLGMELAKRGLDNICITWLVATRRPDGSERTSGHEASGEASRYSSFRSFE